jgi:hypothetical protein
MKQTVYSRQDHDVFYADLHGNPYRKTPGTRIHNVTITSAGERRRARWKLKPGDQLLVEIVDDVSYIVRVMRPTQRPGERG